MDKFIVTVLGLCSIGGIYWFFFGEKEQVVEAQTSWTVTVAGGYTPKTIAIPQNQPSTITFVRTDPNDCLETVVIPEFGIHTFLPLNTPVRVSVSPTKSGTFGIQCGMNMFHGNIIVS